MSCLDLLQGLRILVVEDEYLLAHELMDYLQRVGVEVVGPVATVAGALDLLGTTDVEGAVLDVNLRGERVYPVAEVLLEKHVPFVFASGYSGEVEPANYANIPRCVKPVDMSLLTKMLARQMRQHDSD